MGVDILPLLIHCGGGRARLPLLLQLLGLPVLVTVLLDGDWGQEVSKGHLYPHPFHLSRDVNIWIHSTVCNELYEDIIWMQFYLYSLLQILCGIIQIYYGSRLSTHRHPQTV